MPILKILGSLLIFAVCTLGGFYLSNKLTRRRKALYEITVAADEIAHRIELGEERGQILKKVFEEKTVKVSQDESFNISVSPDFLNGEDISLLNEFFSRLGFGDVASQKALCKTYKRLFERSFDSAKTDEQKKGPMYKTCGCLLAAALIIFII